MLPAAMNPYILPAILSGLPATIAFASTILSQIFSLGLSFCGSGCCSRAPSAYKLVHVQKVSPWEQPLDTRPRWTALPPYCILLAHFTVVLCPKKELLPCFKYLERNEANSSWYNFLADKLRVTKRPRNPLDKQCPHSWLDLVVVSLDSRYVLWQTVNQKSLHTMV